MLVRSSARLFLLSTALFLSYGDRSVVFSAEMLADGVSVFRVESDNWDRVVPAGKEIDAIIGDFVLRNRYVTAVIAQPTASRNANMTVRGIAGCLIDYTTNEQPSDQLSAYYPGARKYPFRSWKIIDRQGKPVHLKQAQKNHDELEIRVTASAFDDRAELVVSYRLKTDSRYLVVTQTYHNTSDKDLTISFSDEVRLDGGKEDMLKSPNGENELYWIDDRFWKQTYGIVCPDRLLTSRSDSRNTLLSYKIEGEKNELVLKAGDEISNIVHWHVASDLCDIRSGLVKLPDASNGTTAMTVLASGTRLPNARIELSQQGKYFGTLWTDGSGRVDQSLPTGEYSAKVSFHGIVLIEKAPLSILKGVNVIELESSIEVGTLKIKVTDGSKAALPCKVELIADSDANQLNFGPESAEVAVKNLLYLHQGHDEVLLPVGEYEAIISRGPEYDALFTKVKVHPDETTSLTATLKRVVDTTGWVSTEFHSHSSPSGDNSGSQFGRVLNLVCEHLEFAPCTEHNRIDTYVPHIKALGIEKFLATCSGMELTGSPLPLNHQNVFPLIRKPHTQDGGGPLTDTSPEKQIQRAALWDNRSDKLVQQNHPDIGWLFYDKNGDGVPDGGYAESLALIETIEIHPLGSILNLSSPYESKQSKRNNRMLNWLQLLNQGYRITGVVNTDSHYNYHGSGGLRNWVKSSTDQPDEIQALEMVHETEKAHLIMSNGPFLSVSLMDRTSGEVIAIPGDGISPKSKKMNLHVRVQCPNWFDIDRVFVLINGKSHPIHNYKRATHPNMFSSQVVKFDQTLSIELNNDAHIVVVAAGENSQLGPVQGPSWGKQQPIAVSNPIFIDADGKGYKANLDTILEALPVKSD
ncbi:MAG: CehA/McbA family metallohydrolase [Planctomycetaceae bacterium]|nr:CehA/McbA family metallohydrolase [Planctomycetaceae bacterium]MBL4886523.1 CehA/McbA family metallohydrolase [Planctomycetaceae bacterium]